MTKKAFNDLKKSLGNFLEKIKIKKKGFLFAFFIILFLWLILPTPTFAALPILVVYALYTLGGIVVGAIADWFTAGITALALLAVIILLLYYFAAGILVYSFGILQSAIRFSNLGFSDTSLNNPIISVGWPIVRDLANMSLVLGLIIIGLATALKINDYQAQKTLPKLLIVALLVNFSPILTGLVVDASNIVMNFFLEDILKPDTGIIKLVDVLATYGNEKFGTLNTLKDIGNRVMIFIIYFFYVVFTGVGILAFGIILMIRHFAIWILVILSPIAFVCWIFPGTNKFWNQWVGQFFAWTFIGVIASFFLYLASHFTGYILGELALDYPGYIPNDNKAAGGIIISYFTMITIFIYAGLYAGLKSSAIGSGATTDWLHKKISPGTIAGWAQKQGAVAGKAVGKVTSAAISARAKPGGFESYQKEQFTESEKRIENIQDTDKLISLAKTRSLTSEGKRSQAAATKKLIKEGNFNSIGDETERKAALNNALNNKMLTQKDVLPYMPEYAAKFKDINGVELTTKDVVDKMESKEIKNIHKNHWTPDVIDAAITDDRKVGAMTKLPKHIRDEIKKNFMAEYGTILLSTTPPTKKQNAFFDKISHSAEWN